MILRIGDRVLHHCPQCEPQPAYVRRVLAFGKTIVLEWDNHPPNVPFFYATADSC